MRIIWAIFLLIISLQASNTYQLPLKSGIWHLVGINGFHHQMPLSQSFESGGNWMTIKETKDVAGLTTWDFVNATTKNSHTTPNIGNKTHSTIGLTITPNSDDLISEAVINYELIAKNSTEPIYKMYIASQGEGFRADATIDFQASYLGKRFFIKFDNSLVFEGVFDHKFSEANPAVLKPRKTTATTVKKIVDLVDTNLTDNSPDKLHLMDVSCETLFCPNASVVVGGRQKLGDANITAYHWSSKNRIWEIYSSRGASNDFDSFEEGKAYWVRIDLPTNATDPAGLILAKGDIADSTYQKTNFINSGWNLLSFDESYLRYTTSAVFVPKSAYDAEDLSIFDNFLRDNISVATNGINLSTTDLAEEINRQVDTLIKSGRNNWKIRAYASIDKAGDEGVVIIGDEDFETNLANESIAGAGLYVSQNGHKTTRTDEYMLAFKPNERYFALTNKQMGVEFGFPSENRNIKSDTSLASDFDDFFDKLANDLTNSKSYQIDTTFDGAMDSVLVASKSRFYMRDLVSQKLFDYDQSFAGDEFAVYGTTAQKANYGADIDETVANINSLTNGVTAHKVGSNQILITSTTTSKIDIKELEKRSQFVLSDLFASDDQLLLGSASEVYSPVGLSGAAIDQGKVVALPLLTDNLTNTPIWSPDFPNDGPLHKIKGKAGASSSGEMIVSGATRDDKTIMWRQSDLTIKPYNWKNSDQRFGLFKLHKERGYWIYMRTSGASEAVGSSKNELFSEVDSHFSNSFATNNSGEISKTQNHIDLSISISAFGLSGLSDAANKMSENVELTIGGKVVPLIKDGSTYNYLARVSSSEFEAIKPQKSTESKGAFVLNITDGRGSKSSATIEYDNILPDVASVDFDSLAAGGFRGGLKIDGKNSSEIIIYDGNLSNVGGNKEIFASEISGELRLNLLDQHSVVYGTKSHPYYDLRVISKRAKMLSDTRRVLYLPLYKDAYLISSNAISDGVDTNSSAIKFGANGQGYQAVVDNNGLPTDGGVQIKTLDKNASDSNTTVMTYQPLAGVASVNCTQEMINIKLDSTSDAVAEVGYCPEYTDRVFYFYHKELDVIGYGVFPVVGGDLVLNVIGSDQVIDDPRRH